MKGNIESRWSSNLAYAVGLLTTDGCLSSDGRHIDMSSVDREQLENFSFCMGRPYKIASKKSGSGNTSLRIQFSDVSFYRFLVQIGLTPNKSKTLGVIKVPRRYAFDFLRGHFDGDGTFYVYKDTRWRSSWMFYLCYASASKEHITWLRQWIQDLVGIKGSLAKARRNSAYQLKYAKKEAMELIPKLYYNRDVICLSRKRDKIYRSIETYVLRGW